MIRIQIETQTLEWPFWEHAENMRNVLKQTIKFVIKHVYTHDMIEMKNGERNIIVIAFDKC